jgi:hypothetical protein
MEIAYLREGCYGRRAWRLQCPLRCSLSSLYWLAGIPPHTVHAIDWRGVWFRTAPAILLMLPPGYLTPLYRHLLPETDHLRHRGHGVQPTTPPRCVTAVDTCVEQYLLRRILLTSRGALTSGQVRVGSACSYVTAPQSGNPGPPAPRQQLETSLCRPADRQRLL